MGGEKDTGHIADLVSGTWPFTLFFFHKFLSDIIPQKDSNSIHIVLLEE